MIRVTIELVPFGIEARKRELARLEIGNITPEAKASDTLGDYQVKAVVGRPNGDLAIHNRLLRQHPRLQWNVLGLVYAALEALGPDTMRNDDSEHSLE